MSWQTALSSLGGTLMVSALLMLCAVLLWSIVEMTRIVLAHRERMALIARGMHPDRPGDAERTVGPAAVPAEANVASTHISAGAAAVAR